MKKRVGKSTNMYVMFGLLAVLFISLGYLSMQSKEGLEGKKEEEKKTTALEQIAKTLATAPATASPSTAEKFRGKQGFRVREGLETACPEGKTRKIPGGPCV